MSITYAGDLMVSKNVNIRVNYDKIVVNLEAPITDRRKPIKNKVSLRSDPRCVDNILSEDIDAVCLANNHIMDYGDDGLVDTLRYLENRSVKYFGAGRERANFNNPAYIYDDGQKIALLGYVCKSTSPIYKDLRFGCAPLSVEKITKDIENKVCDKTDQIVVSLHWGAEEVSLPKPRDVSVARELAKTDVSLIIGHHAHIIQSYENVEDTDIFYGLGNFVLAQSESDRSSMSRVSNIGRQYYWNKSSLLVQYTHSKNNFTCVQSYRRNDEVVVIGENCPYNVSFAFDMIIYDAIYSVIYSLCRLRKMAWSFITNPKMIKYEHIINIYEILIGGKKD
jgi:poly-gamma-glutamate synthesis protein (capsule biosynthesis protein)